MAMNVEKRGRVGIKLSFGESLNLWRERQKTRLESWRDKDMSDGMSEDEERLVIYSQPKGDSDDNKIHVHMEHANKIEVVIPLKRE